MVLNGDDVRFKYFFTKSPSDNGRSNPAIRICWMRGPTLIFYLKIEIFQRILTIMVDWRRVRTALFVVVWTISTLWERRVQRYLCRIGKHLYRHVFHHSRSLLEEWGQFKQILLSPKVVHNVSDLNVLQNKSWNFCFINAGLISEIRRLNVIIIRPWKSIMAASNIGSVSRNILAASLILSLNPA